MNVHLFISIFSYRSGGSFSQKGSFSVRVSDFKKNPDKSAALPAYAWLKKERYLTNEYEIQKVVYDGENDITELVKKIRIVPKDDLPF
ncbi:hypothetical protein [Peribacillus glennii]|uniref:Uncharacterized protein n=1 Tax=Peribacillus glennii TaxID=2303991 RepID=A0A372L7I3_9BACI|nr:hypothetical protein [Peribacillus glennii]RFU61214.1 hypothetical protein D0466_18520 [Peribacillus glennii]